MTKKVAVSTKTGIDKAGTMTVTVRRIEQQPTPPRIVKVKVSEVVSPPRTVTVKVSSTTLRLPLYSVKK
jgi:hypothetical protein